MEETKNCMTNIFLKTSQYHRLVKKKFFFNWGNQHKILYFQQPDRNNLTYQALSYLSSERPICKAGPLTGSWECNLQKHFLSDKILSAAPTFLDYHEIYGE